MENLDAGSNPNYVPEFTIHGGGNLQSEYENSPNMPTFILDGFEVSSEKIFDLDPNRVASITILKVQLRLLSTVRVLPREWWSWKRKRRCGKKESFL